MNTELETYFDNYNELFNSEGFKQLVKELSDNALRLADIQSVKDAEDLHFRKGQVAALVSVINLPDTIAAAREQAETESEEVEEAMVSDVTRGGLAKDTKLVATEIEFDTASQKTGLMRLTYLIHYNTIENAVQTGV